MSTPLPMSKPGGFLSLKMLMLSKLTLIQFHIILYNYDVKNVRIWKNSLIFVWICYKTRLIFCIFAL